MTDSELLKTDSLLPPFSQTLLHHIDMIKAEIQSAPKDRSLVRQAIDTYHARTDELRHSLKTMSFWDRLTANTDVKQYNALSDLYAVVHSQFPVETNIAIPMADIEELNHKAWNNILPTDHTIPAIHDALFRLIEELKIT